MAHSGRLAHHSDSRQSFILRWRVGLPFTGLLVNSLLVNSLLVSGLLIGGCARAQSGELQEALPTQLPAMTAVQNVPLDPYEDYAKQHGFSCMDMGIGTREFTYQNAALATQSMNEWLQGHNMQTQTVSDTPGLIQWKAWNQTERPIYAIWESTQAGGNLWMCSGTDAAMQSRAEAQQNQATQAAATKTAIDNGTTSEDMLQDDTPHYSVVRIPIGLMFAVGAALLGGLSRLVNRFRRPAPRQAAPRPAGPRPTASAGADFIPAGNFAGRDGAGRDGAGRDGAGRDGAARDGAVRDGLGRDSVGRASESATASGTSGTTANPSGREGRS